VRALATLEQQVTLMNDPGISLRLERCDDLLRLRDVVTESAPVDVCHVVPTTMLLQLFQFRLDSPSIEDYQWGFCLLSM
jgi:hypothetical protein